MSVLETDDIIFQREIRRLKLASKFSAKNKLPLKKDVQNAYKGRKIPLAVQVRTTLRDGAVLKRVVEITYRKTTTSELKKYRIEPYSYRYLMLKVGVRKMVFGWDIKDKRIKSFAMRNITAIKLENSKFSPRFPVEIGKKIKKTTIRRVYKH